MGNSPRNPTLEVSRADLTMISQRLKETSLLMVVWQLLVVDHFLKAQHRS
jgi:hypothetical protein